MSSGPATFGRLSLLPFCARGVMSLISLTLLVSHKSPSFSPLTASSTAHSHDRSYD